MSLQPYIEGSTPIYSQEELDKLDELTVEYDGKKMTEYEARQRMRYNERQIRRWKREEAALNAAGLDSSEAAAKLSAWQARQRDFVDQTGFKRQYGLEQISVANQDQSGILGTETTNLAKSIDSILLVDDVSEHKYTPSEILEEMQKSPIGIETIRFIRDSDALICIVDEIQMHSDRGSQEGNVINIFSANIKNQRVAGQTVIHEIAHLRYQIGHCQHAEAICFAMEKMHLLGRNYLTTEEWEQMVALAKYAYPEYGWEDGGYGDFSKFNCVSE